MNVELRRPRRWRLQTSRIPRLPLYKPTELDVSRFPDEVTFNDLQPRMLCTVCDHRGADVGPSWLHRG